MRIGGVATLLSLAASACAAVSPSGYDVAVVQVPEAAPQAETHAPLLERPVISPGVYLAQVSFSSSQGCSQSWYLTAQTGTVKLRIEGRRVALDLDLDLSTSFGSRQSPADAHHDAEKLAGTWEGEVQPTEQHHPDGGFRATLVQRACGEGCNSRTFEIKCKRQRIPLTGPADGPPAGAGKETSNGAVPGIVCNGLPTNGIGTDLEAFPLAPGAGLALSSDEFGAGLRVSIARAAETR